MATTRYTLAGTPSLLRAINDRAALELLLANGPLSRTQIGAMTGLSKPTASQLLGRLESAGLVVPVGTLVGKPGPNALLYQVNPAAGYVAGLDVTNTTVRIAVADIAGTVLAEHQVPTKGWSAARTIGKVAEAVSETVSLAGLADGALHEAVIGLGGVFDPATGKLRYATHLAGWHPPRLVAELETAIGTSVSIGNDVNLVAIAEQTHGAAQGCEDFVLLWTGTGIGAAIVIAGQLHRGFNGGAGEVGYMPLPGAPIVHDVRRKNSGGFQELAGEPAVLALARSHGLTAPTGALVVTEALDTPGEGDAFLAELASRLALGLASIVSVIDPELLILAGEMPCAGGERLRGLVEDALAELTVLRPEVRSSALTGSPVLQGALQRALASTRDAVFSTH
ncbi:ROK family transcriptional regulator [Nocardia altamirensis]|uniref:ROK family transcriptional regulator n=1 Tax=Nocardia altamirensis TaxID=472158 RepID=UPI0008409522|nr:ROK family transcriptional regulator [Nocardia altamirensis]